VSEYFLTTAIDYSNGDPHLGHAYEKIGADAIAPLSAAAGDDVHFSSAWTSTGRKSSRPRGAGIAPQALVDTLADHFQAMWKSSASPTISSFARRTSSTRPASAR
jgi:methionyl-tRNA synthetase